MLNRAFHESSQPRFGPNLHSTQLSRVTEKMTYNQPKYGLDLLGRIIGWNGSDHQFGGLDLLLGIFVNFIGFNFFGPFWPKLLGFSRN